MRDGIALSRAGLAVVVIVHDAFERAARAQAAALGRQSLRVYACPQPGRAITSGETLAEAKRDAAAVAALLASA